MKDKNDNITLDLITPDVHPNYHPDLTIWFRGKKALRLNSRLIIQTDRTNDQIDRIKQLHLLRLQIEESMEKETIPVVVKAYFAAWTDNQFLLQDAWGFPRDQAYHMFWNLKACSCPLLDNSDRYPTGYYIHSSECLIHGQNS